MREKRCGNCGDVIVGKFSPCPSCGNKYAGSDGYPSTRESLYREPVKPWTRYLDKITSVMNVMSTNPDVVLSRSFSTFFEHPFLFIGLCIMAQIPGTVVNILLWNSGTAGRISSTAISFVFALIAQGAIACGVYDALRGNGARFGESLIWGMGRVGPLALGGLSLVISFFLEISLSTTAWGATVLVLVGNIAGVF